MSLLCVEQAVEGLCEGNLDDLLYVEPVCVLFEGRLELGQRVSRFF